MATKKKLTTKTKHQKEIEQWQKLAGLLFDSFIHEHTTHKKYGKNSTYCKICAQTRALYWKMQFNHFTNEEEYYKKYRQWNKL